MYLQRIESIHLPVSPDFTDLFHTVEYSSVNWISLASLIERHAVLAWTDPQTERVFYIFLLVSNYLEKSPATSLNRCYVNNRGPTGVILFPDFWIVRVTDTHRTYRLFDDLSKLFLDTHVVTSKENAVRYRERAFITVTYYFLYSRFARKAACNPRFLYFSRCSEFRCNRRAKSCNWSVILNAVPEFR